MAATLLMNPSTLCLRGEAGDLISGTPQQAWDLLGDGSANIHLNAPGNPVEFAISSDNISKLFLLDGASDTLALASLGSASMFYMDGPNNRVGISNVGLLPLSGVLHIRSGIAGVAAANGIADELVLEGSDSTGLSILTPDANVGWILFGGPTSNTSGRVAYNQSAKQMTLWANNINTLSIDITAGFIWNDGGRAASDFRVASDLNPNMFFVNAGNNSVHVGNNVTTGAGDGDLVMANNTTLRFLNNTSSSSANFGISGTSINGMQFTIPTNNSFNWTWGVDLRAWFQNQNGGFGLQFNGVSSADHGAPSADNGVIYIKKEAGATELFFRNSAEVQQISGTSAGLVLLETIVASNQASVDFDTNIDWTEFQMYRMVGLEVNAVVDNTSHQLRISQDNGTTYKAGATDYRYSAFGGADGGTAGEQSNGASQIVLTLTTGSDGPSNGVANTGTLDVYIVNPQSTTVYKEIYGVYTYFSANGKKVHLQIHGKYDADTNAMDGIQFRPGSGNINSGIFKFYGVK